MLLNDELAEFSAKVHHWDEKNAKARLDATSGSCNVRVSISTAGLVPATTSSSCAHVAIATGVAALAAAAGPRKLAISLGVHGAACGRPGNFLVLCNWQQLHNGEWCRKEIKTFKVDGETVKPNVVYELGDSGLISYESEKEYVKKYNNAKTDDLIRASAGIKEVVVNSHDRFSRPDRVLVSTSGDSSLRMMEPGSVGVVLGKGSLFSGPIGSTFIVVDWGPGKGCHSIKDVRVIEFTKDSGYSPAGKYCCLNGDVVNMLSEDEMKKSEEYEALCDEEMEELKQVYKEHPEAFVRPMDTFKW